MQRDGRLWHPVDVDAFDHRKWLDIAEELGEGAELAIAEAGWLRLQLYAARHHPDGDFGSEVSLRRALRGLPSNLLELFRKFGLLDGTVLHDFTEWRQAARRRVIADDRRERRARPDGEEESVRTDVRTNVRTLSASPSTTFSTPNVEPTHTSSPPYSPPAPPLPPCWPDLVRLAEELTGRPYALPTPFGGYGEMAVLQVEQAGYERVEQTWRRVAAVYRPRPTVKQLVFDADRLLTPTGLAIPTGAEKEEAAREAARAQLAAGRNGKSLGGIIWNGRQMPPGWMPGDPLPTEVDDASPATH